MMMCLIASILFAFTAADFAPERPDGSTMRSLAWLHGELTRAENEQEHFRP